MAQKTNALTRRRFVQSTAALGAAAAFPATFPAFARATRRAEPLKILVLGGTGFIGPHIVQEALDRGHEVTLFNRGRTNTDLFPELQKLRGDRDPDVGEGLGAIKQEVDNGRQWHGVIDTAGYYPRIVSASAKMLADNAEHYVFISSISVYADQSKPGLTEDADLATMEDPTVEEMGDQFQNYGALKALCEQSASEAFEGRAALIRPGFIVGPYDRAFNRFPLWCMRLDAGGERIAPGTPQDPLQYIDARDLAKLVVDSIEKKLKGAYNATGPRDILTISEFIDGLIEGIDADVEMLWIPAEFLAEHEASGSFIPWLPPDSESAGIGGVNVEKAVAAGLTFRPVEDSARDTLEWLKSEDGAEVRQRVQDLMARGAEEVILKAWKERSGSA